jgi:hypothetical protein
MLLLLLQMAFWQWRQWALLVAAGAVVPPRPALLQWTEAQHQLLH